MPIKNEKKMKKIIPKIHHNGKSETSFYVVNEWDSGLRCHIGCHIAVHEDV